ncbi:HNH endonuclease signature motif containing protein [Tersicoccus sp. Bi-70]|uniref:HNH endonuclease signature motif containing protein n=1 Tax=Tersicoccus sp. Bi-70 TaxID=1897634 RepID=UPI0009766A21|nr:HNH endonuclease signature motif containing protein [Tersicoccus sp. Bi-70]OMH33167.1 hypothetical protein BGP79_06465 [Tersicoccus sp. Bi-70]
MRRLESWLAWAKHRAVRATMALAQAEHERWVEAHPEPDGGRGLPRAERLAVGQRSAVAEIAGALQIGEKAVYALVRRADLLADHLSATDAALGAALLTGATATIIADEVQQYADGLASATDGQEAAVFRHAMEDTESSLLDVGLAGCRPDQLKARARRLRERCHPISFSARHAAALADRHVRITPDGDGMAVLTAVLPAAVAFRIDGRLGEFARALQAAETITDPGLTADPTVDSFGIRRPAAPSRTLTQLRADVLADLLTGAADLADCAGDGTPDSTGTGRPGRFDAGRPGRFGSGTVGTAGTVIGRSGGAPTDAGAMNRVRTGTSTGTANGATTEAPAPRVLLTIPASTLLGGHEPGVLGEFGPITAAEARELAATAASLMLGLTVDDPGGAVLRTDSRIVPVIVTDGRQYRIPDRLRRSLAVRDGICRFPGCRRTATSCDVDHLVAWADGGSSEPGNLTHLCRKHHVLKHHSGWSVASAPPEAGTPGSLIWRSPTGRHYPAEPEGPPF